MKIKNELLKLLEFPDSINFSDKIKYSETDSQGISTSERIILDGKYIDYYKYSKREKDEFWQSIDIYIKIEKNENVIIQLNKFLEHKEFNDIENNERIFEHYINDNCRVELIKIENRLVFLITKFNTRNNN